MQNLSQKKGKFAKNVEKNLKEISRSNSAMKGNTLAINRRIIRVLRSYTDDKCVRVEQNRHIKVIGTYDGVLRSFQLSVSASSNYETSIRTALNRFLRSIGIDRYISKGIRLN